MGSLVIRGLLTRKLRSALTAIAIVLGVAMISGTFVLTDQISGAFDSIFQAANKGTDAVVKPNPVFGSDTDASDVPLYVPESLVARVKKVPGVRAADGEITEIGVPRRRRQAREADRWGSSDPRVRGPRLPSQQTRRGALRVARQARNPISRSTRASPDREHLKVGQLVQVATADRAAPGPYLGDHQVPRVDWRCEHPGRVPGDHPGRGSASRVKLSEIRVAANPGISPGGDRGPRACGRRLPAGRGEDGCQGRDGPGRRRQRRRSDSFLTPALLAFGVIAVFVGAFIIFNTFSITVAQRLREFAMLRTLGASRRQVLRVVTAEALVIGLLSSIIGLARRLSRGGRHQRALQRSSASACRRTAPSLAVRTVVLALMVGVGVTLVASIGPARRATKIPPIAALREGAVLPRGRLARFAPVFAVVIVLVGVAADRAGVLGVGQRLAATARDGHRSAARVRRGLDAGSLRRASRSLACSAGRSSGSPARPAGSPVRTRCGTRPGRPVRPPR